MASCELNLKATELCLALPGAGAAAAAPSINVVELMVEAAPPAAKVTGKRGFSETVDLNLNDLQQEDDDHKVVVKNDGNNSSSAATPPPKHYSSNKPPAPKAQVVGWPPVRSYRKNVMAQKNNMNTTPAAEDVEAAVKGGGIIIKSSESCSSGGGGAAFVKVCMDGAPYLRKVDLKMYSSYQQLSDSLAKMFSSFTTIGNNNNNGVGEEGMNMIDFMNERKVMDGVNSSEYVPTYEDKDGDWMLVGDVPWEMFVNSCKRLRIMKGSEAIGLAPRAMEKCKSRA